MKNPFPSCNNMLLIY